MSPGLKKQGIDFFMFPTQTDHRMNLIEKVHGHSGHFVVYKLMQLVFGDQGYYLPWNQRMMRLYCADWRVNPKDFEAILKECVDEGIFNRTMLEQYSILTSAEIQVNYFSVVHRRKSIRFEEKYLLVNLADFLKLKDSEGSSEVESADKQVINNEKFEKTQVNDVDIFADNVDILTIRKEASEAKQVKASETKQGDFFNSVPEFSSKEVDQQSRLDWEKNNESFNQKMSESEEFTTGEATHTEGACEQQSNKQMPVNQTSISDNASQSGKKPKGTKKRPPHPVRPLVIASWEQKFGQIYTNNLDGNRAIRHIIKSLENLIKYSEPGLTEIQLHTKITELWSVIMFSWGRVEPFLAKQIQFDQISKNIANIINQLKINGTASSHTSNNKSNKLTLSQVKAMLRASLS